MNNDLRNIGSNIARARKKAGLSQADLGKELGLEIGAIGKIERGLSKDIGIFRLVEIAKICQTDIHDLTENHPEIKEYLFPSQTKDGVKENSQNETSAGIDWDLLDSITTMIGEIQSEEGFRIKPHKLGGLIRLLYNEANTGLEITKAKVIQLIKLAS